MEGEREGGREGGKTNFHELFDGENPLNQQHDAEHQRAERSRPDQSRDCVCIREDGPHSDGLSAQGKDKGSIQEGT